MPPDATLRRLPDLLQGMAGSLPDVTVSDLVLDSRRAGPGALFLAAQGSREHGIRYAKDAVSRGAAAVLWEPVPGIEVPPLEVPSIPVERLSVKAGHIAARFFNDPSAKLHCIGVTGTDGKTSTAFLAAQAFQRLGRDCFYLGTLGAGKWDQIEPGDLTTPDPIQLQRALHRAVASGCAAAALEVSSHALDQSRIAGTRLRTGILTNVGRDHLDYHRTLAEYAAAKKRLFLDASPEHVVLNRDDEYGGLWTGEFGRLPLFADRLTAYGIGDSKVETEHFVTARNPQADGSGLRFDVETHAGKGYIEAGLFGHFNIYNLLAVLSALLAAEVPVADACDALSKSHTVPGRIEGFRGPGTPLVVVDYAHTPQALSHVLHAVRLHGEGKVICVFGCGGDRDRGKRPLMAAAVADRADSAIVTDDNPRSEDPEAITAQIAAGFPPGYDVQVINERGRAIETAVRQAGPRDIVVVAGKGHETTQTYGSEARPFSDRDFVAALVGGAGE